MYAATWVSNATGSGWAAGASAKPATRIGLTSCPMSGVRSSSSRARSLLLASGPSTASTRPSVPATARDSGLPRRGRGSSRTSATPTAGWAAIHSRAASMSWADAGTMRPGSAIAAARAARGSPVGSSPAVLAAARPSAPDTAPKSRLSWRPLPSPISELGAPEALVGGPPPKGRGVTGRPGPQPSGRPATWAAGKVPSAVSARSTATASSARSPDRGGSRSISVRNSYSRNSRTTVSRS